MLNGHLKFLMQERLMLLAMMQNLQGRVGASKTAQD
jgi:hypothetical protein